MGHEFSGPEPRKSKRVKANFPVNCLVCDPLLKTPGNTENKKIEATMLDLSKEGMAIRSKTDITSTTTSLINFILIYSQTNFTNNFSNIIREITTEGRVVNRNELDKDRKEYRLGIQFARIKEEDKAAIADFVSFVKSH
jgi:c-di-GMP-binding flagellar brake protein YcgR